MSKIRITSFENLLQYSRTFFQLLMDWWFRLLRCKSAISLRIWYVRPMCRRNSAQRLFNVLRSGFTVMNQAFLFVRTSSIKPRFKQNPAGSQKRFISLAVTSLIFFSKTFPTHRHFKTQDIHNPTSIVFPALQFLAHSTCGLVFPICFSFFLYRGNLQIYFCWLCRDFQLL